MRQETNNEIDLLLRRMSRQDGGSARDGQAHDRHRDQHFDVDELSSYAQNALPSAARARYTEHLVDCSTCRKLVTELSLSLGATAAASAPVETVGEPSALKQFLASLFAPMVLRYAVPALGLIVVAAIGFVILRERRRDNFVAQKNTKQNESAPLTATPAAPAPSSSPTATAQGSAQPDRSRELTDSKEAAPKSGSTSSDAAGTGPAPAPKPTPARDENTAPQPGFMAEPAPVAKSAAATESENQKKEEQKKKDEVARKTPTSTATVQTADATVSTARANEPVREYTSAPQTGGQRVDESKPEAPPAQKRTVVGSVGALSRGRAQTDKVEAETRTVSGRRFRKERGIWTDTAYDSSTATVSMARGSEQFRALVADEPEIKKIAEQLDGEVIVVWKGRAYRIR